MVVVVVVTEGDNHMVADTLHLSMAGMVAAAMRPQGLRLQAMELAEMLTTLTARLILEIME
jgi:hypothetical protein